MGVDALLQTLAQCRVLLLDTMVFSYQLANHPRYAPLSMAVLRTVQAGAVTGLTTTISMAELLTIPAKANDRHAMQDYELYLTSFPNLRVVPVDTPLARQAALVRGATGLRMPDAILVAAAVLYHADAIITNDRRWAGKITAPRLLMLDDYAESFREIS